MLKIYHFVLYVDISLCIVNVSAAIYNIELKKTGNKVNKE